MGKVALDTLTSLERSSSQVLPPPFHDRPPNPTDGQENQLLVRDPEFYQFDRGDQKRGGREKNEKYGMGKGEIGEKGGGVEKAAGQMTRVSFLLRHPARGGNAARISSIF